MSESRELLVDDGLDSLEKIRQDFSLNGKQLKFIESYVTNGGNKRKAFDEAGYSAATKNAYYVFISNMMKKDHIQEAIKRYSALYIGERRKVIEKDVFRIAQLRATYDPRDFADLLVVRSQKEAAEKIKLLPESVAVCVDSFELIAHPKNPDLLQIKLKFANRDASIKLLSDLVGLKAAEKKEVHHTGSSMPMINITVGQAPGTQGPELKKVN